MTDELRSLLTDVAEGRVDPSEATAPGGSTRSEPAADQTAQAGTGTAEAPVRRVVVQSSARPVRVVADATVATFTVEGPHAIRRDGETARVEVPIAGHPDAPGTYRYEGKTGISRWLGQATFVGVPLTVRINPDLALEVEVMAGSAEVTGLRGALAFSVTAGSIKATDCSGPFTGTLRAGSAKLDVRPSTGTSHIRVESGSVDLRLQPGSDVRLRAHAELGEVKVRGRDGAPTRVVDREGTYEVVVGAGTASVNLDAVMGSVKVTTP